MVLGASLFIVWPVFIMTLEAFNIDLGPLFSGEGIRFVGGIPFYSGGFYPTIANVLDAINMTHVQNLMLNSLSIVSINVILALTVGIPAAYSFARMHFRGKGTLSFLLLALRTVSPFAVILPLYLLYVATGLWDTYLGMAVAYLALDLPVVVWLIRGFFLEIPKSVYEAAESSGASERSVVWRVALPMILPGIIATAVFCYVLIWNEFLMADLLVGPRATTVTVGVWFGAGGRGTYRPGDFGELNASAALALIPAMAVIVLIRKYLAKAFTLGVAG